MSRTAFLVLAFALIPAFAFAEGPAGREAVSLTRSELLVGKWKPLNPNVKVLLVLRADGSGEVTRDNLPSKSFQWEYFDGRLRMVFPDPERPELTGDVRRVTIVTPKYFATITEAAFLLPSHSIDFERQ